MEKLDTKVKRIEIMALSGSAAADFYPCRDVDWEGTGPNVGDCDDISGTNDLDALFAVILGETYFGPTLNLFMPYILDVDNAGTEDFPWIVTADDGGDERLLLADVVFNRLFGKMYMSNETGDPITVNDWDTGTHFINNDNDAIEFDLPADPTDLTYCFGNGQTGGTPIAQAITLDPTYGDFIVLDGTDYKGAIESSGNGKDNLCIAGLDSSYWKTTGYQGSWDLSQVCDSCSATDSCEDADGSNSTAPNGNDFDTAKCSDWGDEALEANDYIKEAYHDGTLSNCPGRGQYAIEFKNLHAAAETDNVRIFRTVTADGTKCSRFRATIKSTTGMDNGDFFGLSMNGDGVNNETAGLGLIYDGSDYYLYLVFRDNVDALQKITGTTALAENTWYDFGLCWSKNDASDGAVAYLGGDPEATSDTGGHTTTNRNIGREFLGTHHDTTSLDDDDEVIIQIDGFRSNGTTSLPADMCS
jgi:hypothetical protein